MMIRGYNLRTQRPARQGWWEEPGSRGPDVEAHRWVPGEGAPQVGVLRSVQAPISICQSNPKGILGDSPSSNLMLTGFQGLDCCHLGIISIRSLLKSPTSQEVIRELRCCLRLEPSPGSTAEMLGRAAAAQSTSAASTPAPLHPPASPALRRMDGCRNTPLKSLRVGKSRRVCTGALSALCQDHLQINSLHPASSQSPLSGDPH